MTVKVERIVLTGASDGIGKTMAHAFAKRGFELGLIARRPAELEAVRDECLKLGASRVLIESADVTDSPKFRAALARLDSALNGATIFIANAGVGGTSSRTSNKNDNFSEAVHCLSVNVIGAIDGLEWMKEKMVARGEGTLVGVSSIAGIRGLPVSGTYSASKAALSNYLESLRVDLQSEGIRVVTVAPGFIATPMTRVNKGKMPFLMEAEKAGEIFARGILARKKWIVAPWQYYVIGYILRRLPNLVYDRVQMKVMTGIRRKKLDSSRRIG